MHTVIGRGGRSGAKPDEQKQKWTQNIYIQSEKQRKYKY